MTASITNYRTMQKVYPSAQLSPVPALPHRGGTAESMSPVDVAAAPQKNHPTILDVRTLEELELTQIHGATFNTEELAQEMISLPKDTSSSSASDSVSCNWSSEWDTSVPRYESVRDFLFCDVAQSPLHAVVMQAKGCISK